ncbi:MAG: L-histidine N(alpha)-methyltransferase [Acidobacteriota bacterium]
MTATASETLDVAPDLDTIRHDVLTGLAQRPRMLPPKYFYDDRGSELFDRICELDEYYPTRTEVAIMERHGTAMAAAVGPRATLVEYGSGSSLKTEILLDALDRPVACVIIDISREPLEASADRLRERFPTLEVLPVLADYTRSLELPEPSTTARRRIAFYPGSTIGNFPRPAARDFLATIRGEVGVGGGLLIGVDLDKDTETLERAYDDAQGVTADFNRNLLVRLNRELDGNFDLDRWSHRAIYNRQDGRIEMHLVSQGDQRVQIAGESFDFTDGETICTEHSNKYRLDDFRAMAESAGWRVEQVWTDERQWFSVQYLVAS